MSLAALQKDFAAYNLWANRQQIEWLSTKPAEEVEREARSSFSSVKQTLVHIWDAESAWLCHLRELPFERPWGATFEGATEELFRVVLQSSAALADYVQSLPEEAFQEIRHYSIPWVGETDRPRFELIQHCLNHSTYHRGQVITIGHNLGWTDAPMGDYFAYLLHK